MATTYRVLGQLACTDNTEQTVYTVPSATQTIVSTIVCTNRSAVASSFKIAVRPDADSTTSAKHYVFYDVDVNPKSSFVATIGLTLQAGDKILSHTSGSQNGVNVFGSEIA